MKKSLLFCSVVLLCSFIFSGCKNFFGGSDLKKEIEELIAYNTATPFKVRISTNSNQGSITPNGDVSVKIGDTIEIEFIMNADYTFREFICYDRFSGIQHNEAVKLLSLNSSNINDKTVYAAKFQVIDQLENLEIKPRCYKTNDTTPPEFQSDIKAANTLEDFSKGVLFSIENPDDNSDVIITNHSKNSIYIELSVFEEDSDLTEVFIHETIINNFDKSEPAKEFTTKINPPFTWTGDNIYTTNFIYEFKNSKDGTVKLDVTVSDGNNISSPKSIFASKDTKIISDICFYTDAPTLTGYSNDMLTPENANSYSNKLYAEISKEAWDTNNLDNIENMIYEYGLTNNLDDIDTIPLKKLSPVFSYNSYSESISIPYSGVNTSLPIYVIAKITDTLKNSKTYYFEVPSLPKILSKQIAVDKSSSSRYYKNLQVAYDNYTSLNKTHESNYITYHHNLNNQINFQIDTERKNLTFGRSFACWAPDGTFENPNGSEQLNETQFHYQMAFVYTDKFNNERKLYSQISSVQNIQLNEQQVRTPSINSVTITPNNDNFSQKAIFTSTTLQLFSYEKIIVLRKSSYFDKRFALPAKLISPTQIEVNIPTELFYDTYTNTREKIDLTIVGIKDGNETNISYTISSTKAITDNLPPTMNLIGKMNVDYTGKYATIASNAFNDIGGGLPTTQKVEINYVRENQIMDTKEFDLTLQNGITIPIYHLPDGYYNLEFKIHDINGNFTETLTIPLEKFYNTNYDKKKEIDYSKRQICWYQPDSTAILLNTDRISPTTSDKWIMEDRDRNTYSNNLTYFYWSGCKLSESDSFLRIYLKNNNISQSSSLKTEAFAGPFIMYTGPKTTFEIKEIIELSNGVQIYCDYPAFVHTLRSQINWGDDINAWEQHCSDQDEINPRILSDATYAKIPCYYSQISSKYNNGDYYVTIVYFSDGTKMVTKVKQYIK